MKEDVTTPRVLFLLRNYMLRPQESRKEASLCLDKWKSAMGHIKKDLALKGAETPAHVNKATLNARLPNRSVEQSRDDSRRSEKNDSVDPSCKAASSGQKRNQTSTDTGTRGYASGILVREDTVMESPPQFLLNDAIGWMMDDDYKKAENLSENCMRRLKGRDYVSE